MEKNNNIHKITLILPIGIYKYAFKIGGKITESQELEIKSKEIKETNKGYKITMKWYKSNKVTGGFDEIPGKNSGFVSL